MPARSTQNERAASSSRHSLKSSQRQGLGERKKDLFQGPSALLSSRRRQLRQRAFTPDAARAQQNEAIADAGSLADLMDGEEQRPSTLHLGAQGRRDLPRLPEVEPVEGLVDEQQRRRHRPAHGQQDPLGPPL